MTKKRVEDRPKTKDQRLKTKTCWRIFRFQERFELPEDMKSCRKSGLQYTKDFVSAAGGDEAVGYLNQFSLLCNGDGLHNALMEGLYRKLVNMAAAHSRAKRGFLLDADDQPLSDSQIAKILNVKTPEMKRYLNRYKSVKLLEKVDMPDFDYDLNEQPAKAKGGGKKDFRKNPEKSGKKGKALNKSKKESRIGNINTKDKEIEVEEKLNKNSNSMANSSEREPAGGKGTASTPAAAPPNSTKPTKADEPGHDDKRLKAHARQSDGHIADTIDFIKHRYDKASNEFAYDVMFEMGLLTITDMQRLSDGVMRLNNEQAKERGNWTKAWYEASQEFSPENMRTLRVQLFKRIPIAINRGGNPQAYLRTAWSNLVKDMRKKRNGARASPAAVR